MPRARAVSLAEDVPLGFNGGSWEDLSIDGYVPGPSENMKIYRNLVSPGYFDTMGIRIVEGRDVSDADTRTTASVAVVNQTFARRYFGASSPVGRRFTGWGRPITIVGVVGAVKQAGLTEPQGQGAVYLPYAYRDSNSVFIVARMTQRPEAFAGTLRQLVRAADPQLAIDDVRSMDTRIDDSLIARRSPALLAVIFAGVALLLAAIGTYGVLSYAVAQRRREIGIRMALGAQKQQIGAQVLSLGLRLLAAGSALGVLGAWLAGRAMQSVLFEVSSLPIAALLGTAFVMTTVSVVACVIPARRATQVDPMIALRAE